MADKRKLQGEIDRCLKKIQEGIDAFDDIWKKAHSTNNTNQKEKFETDLKKEIKKLQRLRDQIKTWVVSADIKDKETLVDHRKKIESKMEQFKVIERETKTKAYSKEGLLGSAGKVDPKEKEKDDIVNWLQEYIEKLKEQSERLEAEIEALIGRRRKLDREDQVKHEQCKTRLVRNRYHINKLEAILRMVDNAAVQFEQIHKVKDDVEYFIDSIDDPDYEENMDIYAELDLEEIAALQSEALNSSPSESDIDTAGQGTATTTSSNHSESPSPLSVAPTATHSKTSTGGKNTTLSLKIGGSSNGAVLPGAATSAKVPATPTKLNAPSAPSTPSTIELSSASALTQRPPSLVPAAPCLGYAQVAGSHHNAAFPSKIVPNSPKLFMTSSSSAPVSAASSASAANGLISAPPSLAMQSAAVAGGSRTNLGAPVPPSPASSSSSSTSGQQQGERSASPSNPPPPPLPSLLSSSSGVNLNAASSISAGSPSSAAAAVQQQQSQQFFIQNQQQYQLQMLMQQQQQQRQLQAEAMAAESKRLMNGVVTGPGSSAGGPGNTVNSNILSMQGEAGSLASLKSLAHSVMDRSSDLSALTANMSTAPNNATSTSSSSSAPPDSTNNNDISNNGMMDTSKLSLQSSGDQQQQQQAQQLLQQQQLSMPTQMMHLSPLLGVAPLGPQPISKEHVYRQKMLESAFLHLPYPCDSEKVRLYFPSNPCPTPQWYPQTSPSLLNSAEFFNKMDTDSLFFMFYYMEGTKAQYLAAKALKLKSWRFHTKYMMWFQRHEEPKTITEEFEQGTYIYFDYEKWGQRKKEGFRFEYKYLEDQELV